MISLTLSFGILLVTLLWLHYRKKHNYFKDHGILYSPGYLPFGSKLVWKVLGGEQQILQVAEDLYDVFPGAKAFGYYRPFVKPVLVIKDLELGIRLWTVKFEFEVLYQSLLPFTAKRIMIKDFDHFMDRSFMEIHPETNKYLQDISILKGEKWRSARQLMTPLFTAQKLKTMLPWMHKMGEEFRIYLDAHKGDLIVKNPLANLPWNFWEVLG